MTFWTIQSKISDIQLFIGNNSIEMLQETKGLNLNINKSVVGMITLHRLPKQKNLLWNIQLRGCLSYLCCLPLSKVPTLCIYLFTYFINMALSKVLVYLPHVYGKTTNLNLKHGLYKKEQ